MALKQDLYAVQALELDQEELSDLHFMIEQEQQWSAGAEARRAQTESSLRDAELKIEFLEAELASIAQRQAGQQSKFLLQLEAVTKVHTHCAVTQKSLMDFSCLRAIYCSRRCMEHSFNLHSTDSTPCAFLHLCHLLWALCID